MTGNAVGNLDLRQHHLWASLLAIYFEPCDVVSWGYKAAEVEMHGFALRDYLEAFNEFVAETQGSTLDAIDHIFPLRNFGNHSVMMLVQQFGIPRDCLFSCNTLKGNKACGFCGDCTKIELIYLQNEDISTVKD